VPGTTATVTVTVTANTPPKVTAPATVGTADPETGVVSGSVHVSDADGGLTFAVGSRPAPFYGTVTVDAETGDWTFTPTGAARRQAALSNTPSDKQVSFEVTATDGLHTVSTWIKAPITPPDNEVVDVITGTGGRSVGIAVTPDGSRAVIAHANGTVTIINTVTRSVIQTFTVGGLPTDVAISADSISGLRKSRNGTSSSQHPLS
jgi:YVTN family beta-propeller protein